MTSVERKRKQNIEIELNPFIIFVLASVAIHGLGLLGLTLTRQSRITKTQKTQSTPIDFVVIPPEESTIEPSPETKNKAVNNSIAKGNVKPELPIAPKPNRSIQPKTNVIPQTRASPQVKPTKPTLPSKPQPIKQAPKPIQKTSIPKVSKTAKQAPSTPTSSPKKPDLKPQLTKQPESIESSSLPKPNPSLQKEPKTAISKVPPSQDSASRFTSAVESLKPIPPVVKKPQPIEPKPLITESSNTSIPSPEQQPSQNTETTNPNPDLSPKQQQVAAASSPVKTPSVEQKKPVSETTATPSSATNNPISSGSASLLGGTRSRSLAKDSENFFSNTQANASQQATNSSGINARQDLNLGPYFAEIRRRVRRNWKPSAPNNNRNTVLAFSIQRNGQITGLTIRQSSGSPVVDRESLEAVQKSAPFAALPANFPNPQLDVEFNFNIYINN